MIATIDTYLHELEQVIHDLSRSAIEAIVEELLAAWRAQRNIFILGNGGSAATAAHMMNDLNKFTAVEGRPRFRAWALTDNVPWLTAIGNDQSYAEVFVEQLKNFLQAGDVVIGISASGNSPNVVRAVAYAREHGARIIGLCGRPGGRLAELADLKVIIPSDRIGQQEDGHMIIDHVLAYTLRERILQEPPPL